MSSLDGQSATGLFQNYESDFQLAYDELVQKIEEIPNLSSGMLFYSATWKMSSNYLL